MGEVNFHRDLGESAYKDSDGMNYDDTPILSVNDQGFPSEKLDVEALDNSVRAFWLMHEKKLWAIIIACCFWFILVLV